MLQNHTLYRLPRVGGFQLFYDIGRSIRAERVHKRLFCNYGVWPCSRLFINHCSRSDRSVLYECIYLSNSKLKPKLS